MTQEADLLLLMPATTHQLAEACGVGTKRIGHMVSRLRKKGYIIYLINRQFTYPGKMDETTPRIVKFFGKNSRIKILYAPQGSTLLQGATLSLEAVRHMLRDGFFDTGTILEYAGRPIRVRGEMFTTQYVETYSEEM